MKKILMASLILLSGCQTLEVSYDVENQKIAAKITLDKTEW